MIEFLFFIIALFYVWFDTDAWPEYFRWTKTAKEYFEQKKQGLFQDFPTFLLFKDSESFAVRLATCPVCLGVWFGIMMTFIYGTYALVGVNIIAVWVGYAGLRWLLKKFNG